MSERGEQGRRVPRVDRAGRVRAGELQLRCRLLAGGDPEEQIAEVKADDGSVWKTLCERPELRKGARRMLLREAADGGCGESLGIVGRNRRGSGEGTLGGDRTAEPLQRKPVIDTRHDVVTGRTRS